MGQFAAHAYESCLLAHSEKEKNIILHVLGRTCDSVTIGFAFRTADDDPTLRKFDASVSGAQLAAGSQSFFAQTHRGPFSSPGILLENHMEHKEIHFDVSTGRELASLVVPLDPIITENKRTESYKSIEVPFTIPPGSVGSLTKPVCADKPPNTKFVKGTGRIDPYTKIVQNINPASFNGHGPSIDTEDMICWEFYAEKDAAQGPVPAGIVNIIVTAANYSLSPVRLVPDCPAWQPP